MLNFNTSLSHPYALKKGIKSPVFVDGSSNLVCPIYRHGVFEDEDSVLSYQRISECGKIKKFDFGKPISGGYWILGGAPERYSLVLVAEGFATAAAIARHSKIKTAVAYGCGNMDKVATDIVDYWGCQPLLCPDTSSIITTDYPCLPSPSGDKNFDWCDYFQNKGDERASIQFNKERLQAFRGWRVSVTHFATGEENQATV